ncbi:Metallo-dependent phosphatase [Tilletiaria anomala UBC 951]|uniref:Metallo-dependent phosphatase n=1 Tax=Tilletiaria anomala (strain ATCC 24038 / CBS 436.72 / UBC 951) TaxID=1037660 RepID=A0A066W446_TILAU|nr:Metallo-dependent phosphatase [Tilletiaria anomala UBC 951]KDN48501.1 Metallo-dependent phosphatase [Tilletiaria anomala UBC 951]
MSTSAPSANANHGAVETVRLPILHANDVYRIRQSVKSDGKSQEYCASQFAALIHRLRSEWPQPPQPLPDSQASAAKEDSDECHDGIPRAGLTLFSGDVFNPSVESSVTRGEHMLPLMNACGWDTAVLGNHDFDFGFPHLTRLMKECTWKWVFSNVANISGDASRGEGKGRGSEEVDGDEPRATDGQVEGTLPYWTTYLHLPCTSPASSSTTNRRLKVGIIGLIERDWIATVPSFPPEFRYRSMAKTARRLSSLLRNRRKCDLVFALTHARLPNDIDLAKEVGAVLPHTRRQNNSHGHLDHIDLILGGHDHVYYIGKACQIPADFAGEQFERGPGTEHDDGCCIVKSGTDFRDLSSITLEVQRNSGSDVGWHISRMRVERHRPAAHPPLSPKGTPTSYPPLQPLKQELDTLMQRISLATDQPVANSLTAWDCRSEYIRTEENAFGDFCADIILHAYDDALRGQEQRGELAPARTSTMSSSAGTASSAGPSPRRVDLALLCGGAIRGDSIYGPGPISLRDILEILPFDDPIIVKELSGADVLGALENALGAYPKQEGRFPILAGLCVKWDSTRPSGQRVLSARRVADGHLFEVPSLAGDSTDAGTDATGGSGSAEKQQGQMKARRIEIARSRHQDGYECLVYRPAMVLGEEIKRDETYRVVTREYMAQGHDGFVALTRGRYLIDDENGVLMSTLVRKYLLGASFVWRMKQLRAQAAANESNKSATAGGGNAMKSNPTEEHLNTQQESSPPARERKSQRIHDALLSERTRSALDRAMLIGTGPEHAPDARGGDANPCDAPIPASVKREAVVASPSTPKRPAAKHLMDRLAELKRVVDQSPSGMRHAMHIGDSERHGDFDNITQIFRGRSSGAGRTSLGGGHKADTCIDDGASSSSSPVPTTSPTISQPASTAGPAPQRVEVAATDVKGTVTLTEAEAEALATSNDNLAVIAPFVDGRLVDVARAGKEK